MALYTLLVYGIPALLIVATIYVGYLGFKFHIDEVVRKMK